MVMLSGATMRLCPVLILALTNQIVVIHGTDVNIARYATLSASPSVVYGGHDYSKENAVDGVQSYQPDSCNCCYVSRQQRLSTFTARFSGNFVIDRIVISGRSDNNNDLFLLSNLHVSLDGTYQSVSLNSARNEATVRLSFRTSHVHTISISRQAQSFGDGWYLTICELEVWSSGCIDGYYGDNCNHTCGGCRDGQCSKADGRCLRGCYSGYQGDRCDSCTDGFYGAPCNLSCGNCTNVTCDRQTGICLHGCVAGYQGTMCDTDCDDGSFGPNCTFNCYCKNQTACDDQDGFCQDGCDIGWIGSNCSEACPEGTYGQDCVNHCHCLNQGHCDRIYGNCSTGCDFGWIGFNCSIALTSILPDTGLSVNFIRPYEDNAHRVNVSVPIVFMGKSYSSFYISKDGLVSFTKPSVHPHQNWSAPAVSPFIDIPFIAPYYYQAQFLDILRDYTGVVTFSELSALQIAKKNLSEAVRSTVVGSGNFVADWGIQITWSNVTSVKQIETGPCKGTYSNPCPTNTFQLVLLSNGADSYAMFNYGRMAMPPEKYDQAGFNGGRGLGWTNVLPAGTDLDQLSREQGSNVAARFTFKISSREIVRAGCFKTQHYKQLTVFPNYAGMDGGKMIDISGPCFSKTDDIRCRFGANQPGGQQVQETKADYISKTRVRCMVPRLLVRDRITLSLALDGNNFEYQTPFTIIFPGRMPKSEKVIAVSPSSANSWYSKQPSTLTLTWDGSLLNTDPNARVDIMLYGYRETNGKSEYKKLAVLGTWVHASAGTYTFHTAEHQCVSDDCFSYEIGTIVVELQDRFTPLSYRYLTSKILPLAWWVYQAMDSIHGVSWPSALCVDWYNKDRQDTTWLQNLLHCPCSLEQALADFGRWQPDMVCNIVNDSPNNCFYHKGAVHCVRAVQPVGRSGNQCCYNKQGQLVFAQDTFQGSTPDRSHDWGAAPYGKPGFIPGLSHWLTDVVTFYYCCLWNEYSSCDYYMDSRPTMDCVGYTPPAIAGVYGQGHVTPFGGPAHNFRLMAPGDYTLLKADDTVIQGRFEKNLFPTETGKTVSSVYSLTAVAVKILGVSDTVELLLRGPDTNNDHQKIDVRVNGKYLEFDDHALAWHDLKGVAVINTDRSRRVQSNFTVILTNNIGLQVVEAAHTLQMDVVVPRNTFNRVAGILGDLNGTLWTPHGIEANVTAPNTTNTHLYYTFEEPWMVHNQSESLIHGFMFAYQFMFGSVDFDPKPIVPACSSSVCNGKPDCQFDLSHTCSEEIASMTRQAEDRLAMLRQYLYPVKSCGMLDVPRAVKSDYGYTMGTTTIIQKCRLGSLSGPTNYTCAATSNQTQAWTPAVTSSCGNFTQPILVG